MPQPSFPLYRLPYLMRHEVIKAMNPLELLTLSKTSRKSYSLVKSVTKRFSLHILLITRHKENFVLFGFGKQLSGFKIKTHNVIETHNLIRYWRSDYKNTVPIDSKYDKNNLIIYGSDRTRGFTKAIELLINTFNVKRVLFIFVNQYKFTIKQILACSEQNKLESKSIIGALTASGRPYYQV